MDKPRPYLTAALFCQQVLQEKDESLTVVRIADRIQYSVQFVGPQGKSVQRDLTPMIDVQGLISLKSGPVVGDHTVKVISERPNGQRKDVGSFAVKLLGKDHGVNLILHLGLVVELDGLYWFDVTFDDELLTRVPLMLIPAPVSSEEK